MPNPAHVSAVLRGNKGVGAQSAANPGVPLDLGDQNWVASPTQLSSLAGFHFAEFADFARGRFPPGFEVSSCTFAKGGSFAGAVFEGDVLFKEVQGNFPDLSNARFHGNLRIVGVRTRADLTAPQIVVNGVAQIALSDRQPSVDLRRAVFKGGLVVSGLACDRGLAMHAVQVTGDCQLRGQLEDTLDLRNSSFSAILDLAGMVLNGGVDATKVTCEGHTSLANAKLGRNSSFREASFDKSLAAGCAIGDSVETGGVDFSDARFGARADFSGRHFLGRCRFDGAQFSNPPEFFNCKFGQDTSFRQAVFPIGCEGANGELEYRALKLAMNELQSHHDELLFFSLEMRARASLEARSLKGLLFGAYWLLSRAGQSVLRPLVALLFTVVLGGIVLWMLADADCWGRLVSISEGACAWSPGRMEAIASISLAQSIPFVPVIKGAGEEATRSLLDHAGTTVRVSYWIWALVQSLASIAFWFLAALAVRNMFRMR